MHAVVATKHQSVINEALPLNRGRVCHNRLRKTGDGLKGNAPFFPKRLGSVVSCSAPGGCTAYCDSRLDVLGVCVDTTRGRKTIARPKRSHPFPLDVRAIWVSRCRSHPLAKPPRSAMRWGESDRRWCSWEPIASRRLFGILNMQVRKEEGRLTRVILPAWLSVEH